MATKFRTDSTNAKPPAWCFKAIFPPAIALVSGNPSRLVCFAYWLDLNIEPNIDITESFILEYNQAADHWHGKSAATGLRLAVTVIKDHPTTLYHIVLDVWRNDLLIDDDSWHQVPAGFLPLFDSKELHHIHDAGVDANGVHVVA